MFIEGEGSSQVFYLNIFYRPSGEINRAPDSELQNKGQGTTTGSSSAWF